jgi:hypothetical protein
LKVNAEGKFTMDHVPTSYEYLFDEDKVTWKKQPSINPAALERLTKPTSCSAGNSRVH